MHKCIIFRGNVEDFWIYWELFWCSLWMLLSDQWVRSSGRQLLLIAATAQEGNKTSALEHIFFLVFSVRILRRERFLLSAIRWFGWFEAETSFSPLIQLNLTSSTWNGYVRAFALPMHWTECLVVICWRFGISTLMPTLELSEKRRKRDDIACQKTAFSTWKIFGEKRIIYTIYRSLACM